MDEFSDKKSVENIDFKVVKQAYKLMVKNPKEFKDCVEFARLTF